MDALRGFDMFWITGGAALAWNLSRYSDWGWLKWFGGQMSHAPFIGFTLLDLIFPLFLFIAGLAVPYSLGRKREQGVPRHKLLRRSLIRCVLLVFLGAVYNGLLQWNPLHETRICSVLGFIGIGYFFAACIYLYCDALGFWRWSFFFIVIGMNPITIYLGTKLVKIGHTSNFLFGGLINHLAEPLHPLARSATYILTWWIVLFYMYRKKIFLKV